MQNNQALKFATSLISLTLVRNQLRVHVEPRSNEALLHSYPEDASVTTEAEFFVRVQAHADASAAKAAREANAQPSLYGKPTYLAQVVGNGAVVVVSAPLAKHMLYTERDIGSLETF